MMKKCLIALMLALAALCLTTAAALADVPTVDDTSASFYANGTAVIIDAPDTGPGNRTCIASGAGTHFSNVSTTFPGGALLYWGDNASGGYVYAAADVIVYGGGYVAFVTGDTSVTMHGGVVNTIYGGGEIGYVTGDTEVSVSDGTVTNVYGGGKLSDANVDGSTEVSVSGGTVNTIYGGGESGDVTGDTSVTISSGAVGGYYIGDYKGMVCGGGYNGAVGGNAAVSISGGTVNAVYGGGYFSTAVVKGSTSMTITGGTIKQIGNSGIHGEVLGNTSMTITGGTIRDDFSGISSAVRGSRIVRISGGPVIGDRGVELFGIELACITGYAVDILDMLTGGEGAITLMLNDTVDGTVVARTANPMFANPNIFAAYIRAKPDSYGLRRDGSNIVIAADYDMTENEWTKGDGNDMTVISGGDHSKFTNVSVDGIVIDRDLYTHGSGSTVVTLKASYLETLAVGVHRLRIHYSDGFAEGTFTIHAPAPPAPKPPKTGDDGAPLMWLGLCVFCGVGFAVMMRKRRKA